MLNFFKETSFAFRFTKFAIILLFIANFAKAAININTAGNAEIADFIVYESVKILQVPEPFILDLNFQTAKDKHGRAGILFFWGEREVSIKADYGLLLGNDSLKGTVKADTSWLTHYCGVLECQTKPMPAEQRINVIKTLVTRLLTELNGRIHGAFPERPVAAPAPAAPVSVEPDPEEQ
ncbi:MAG: hypothetical protein LBU89_05785 [Fibromonadaceae bacterium]|nr:hypothetical protein [Fibromonadaceae bacterium]